MTVVSTLSPSDMQGRNKEIILQIFSSIGRCRFLEERHFDACTALSGSGPAFACIFLEAMVDGGVMMGLPRAEALELAAQCACTRACDRFLFFDLSPLTRSSFYIALQGAARMALLPDAHPAQIKDSVTSKSVNSLTCGSTHAHYLAPGGCTIAGLLALEDGRVRSTIARAIQVATERASELGQPTTK
jgi:pyrroline-5-carboxylate reductase